jgi:hypothetical protein
MGSVGNKRSWSVTRRDFLTTTGAIAGAVGLAPALSAPFVSKALAETKMLTRGGGHLYMQTNETRNAIIHYHRSANGTLTEVERVATGGAGSGLLSPIYHVPRPNHFEGAGSVILTPDRRLLLTTNGGDNSVSSFAVGKEGRLTLVDVKRSTRAQACPLNCAGWRSRRMTDWCSRRTSVTAPSAAIASTATCSPSRRIPRPRRFREMAPTGRSTEPLAAARAIAGFRPMAPISTKSTGMPRNWWATPLSRTVRSTRSPA